MWRERLCWGYTNVTQLFFRLTARDVDNVFLQSSIFTTIPWPGIYIYNASQITIHRNIFQSVAPRSLVFKNGRVLEVTQNGLDVTSALDVSQFERHFVWKFWQNSYFFRYKPMLILKPWMMLFCPWKILLNSFQFFLYCKIAELGRIEKNLQGAKKHLSRFSRKLTKLALLDKMRIFD